MKKIVIDARESGTSTGRYIDKLIEYLHKLEMDIDFVILTKEHRLDFFRNITPNFAVIGTPFKEFSFGEQIGFRKQIKSLKPDLVHFAMIQQPVLYIGKTVTTMHDLIMTWENNPSRNLVIHKVKQVVYKWVNKVAARKTSAIIVPTIFIKKDVTNFTGVNPDKITVTYEAADKISEKPESIKALIGKQFLMYIGRPMPHKNLDRLIDAFAHLKNQNPDLHLALAGKKDINYERIENEVKQKNIRSVVFTGFVSEGQLRWMYENCSVYVFPSLSEGFGLPALEAMVHGAPVASSNATCLPEVYGNAAHYFDPENIESMTKAIGEVLSNKKLCEKLISNGYVQAKKYSWERMAKQTLEIYKTILK